MIYNGNNWNNKNVQISKSYRRYLINKLAPAIAEGIKQEIPTAKVEYNQSEVSEAIYLTVSFTDIADSTKISVRNHDQKSNSDYSFFLYEHEQPSDFVKLSVKAVKDFYKKAAVTQLDKKRLEKQKIENEVNIDKQDIDYRTAKLGDPIFRRKIAGRINTFMTEYERKDRNTSLRMVLDLLGMYTMGRWEVLYYADPETSIINRGRYEYFISGYKNDAILFYSVYNKGTVRVFVENDEVTDFLKNNMNKDKQDIDDLLE